jgi:hypothetical protein
VVRNFKEIGKAYLKILPLHLQEETEENHRKPVNIAGMSAEIQIGYM